LSNRRYQCRLAEDLGGIPWLGAELIGEVSYGENKCVVQPGRAGGLEEQDSYLCQFDIGSGALALNRARLQRGNHWA
jgi:hypothetical protein